MRVAMLGLYPPNPDHIVGGVEAVTYFLSHALTTFPNVEIHAVTFRPHLSRPQVLQHGDVVVYLLPTPRAGRLLWHRPSVRRLHRLLSVLSPDIVHSHGSTMYTAAAVSSSYPHVVTVHGIMAREAPTVWGWRRRLAREVDRWFERWVLAQAREIIAISPYVREAYPWLRARFHLVENPVNPRFFDVPEDAVATGNVLCVARVIPRKGVLTLIRAFARVAGDFPGAELHIAGETESFPEYAAACREEVRRRSLEHRIHFLGPLTPDDLADAYGRAQVVTLASVQETAPVVIAEALAAGRPVVATAVGGVPYMVRDKETGWLVPPGDDQGLARALAAALQNPERCVQMGRAARAEAQQRFHPLPLAEKHLHVYDIVMGRA